MPINSDLAEAVRDYVKRAMSANEGAHDYYHTERVCRVALKIAQDEPADQQLVELAALLHDIADHKFHGGDITAGPREARKILGSLQAPSDLIDKVCTIISEVSFKGANVPDKPTSLEAQIVQDADRLDAIGAIGIARTFAYGGSRGSKLHNPDENPQAHKTFESYSKSTSSTINHFYEKLLLLKDRMHTRTAQRLADERHRFMEKYLDQFYREWDSIDAAELKPAGKYYIYILQMNNGKFYTGQTNNPNRRFSEHKKNGAKLTHAFGVDKMLQCWEIFDIRGTAMKIERFVKSLSRQEKEEIVRSPKKLKTKLDKYLNREISIRKFPINNLSY